MFESQPDGPLRLCLWFGLLIASLHPGVQRYRTCTHDWSYSFLFKPDADALYMCIQHGSRNEITGQCHRKHYSSSTNFSLVYKYTSFAQPHQSHSHPKLLAWPVELVQIQDVVMHDGNDCTCWLQQCANMIR